MDRPCDNYYYDKQEYKRWKHANKPPGLIRSLVNAACTPQPVVYANQQPMMYQQPRMYPQQEVIVEPPPPAYQPQPVMFQQSPYPQQRVIMEQPMYAPQYRGFEQSPWQQPMPQYYQGPPQYQQGYMSGPGPVVVMNERESVGDLMLDALVLDAIL